MGAASACPHVGDLQPALCAAGAPSDRPLPLVQLTGAVRASARPRARACSASSASVQEVGIAASARTVCQVSCVPRRPKALTQVTIFIDNFTPRCAVLETSIAPMPEDRWHCRTCHQRHVTLRSRALLSEGLPTIRRVPQAQSQGDFASRSPSFSSRSLLHDVGMVPSCSLPKTLREWQSGLGTGAPVSPFRVMANALGVPCRPHPDVAGRPGGPAEPRLRSGRDLAAPSRRRPHAQCAVC